MLRRPCERPQQTTTAPSANAIGSGDTSSAASPFQVPPGASHSRLE
jgi:hypothetical protein